MCSIKLSFEQLAILLVNVLQISKIIITNSKAVCFSLLLYAISTSIGKSVKLWVSVSFLAAGVIDQLETKNLLCVMKARAF